ncbi:MAG TPA: transglutaminase domain-containing protein [Candidatus Limnocylindrales bacterium]
MSALARGGGPDRGSGTPSATWTAATQVAESEPRRFPLAPDEGWLTILLVLLLVLPVAWSIDDARWVLGQREWTRFLPWAIVGGAVWGMIGAKVGWGRWTTHLLGAVMAALLVPIMVGSVLVATGGSPGAWFHATSDAAVEAVLDFTVRNRTVTAQTGHHLLILGLICWGTAQFAGFAVLGHRRPLGAVFVTGLVLLTNMSITRNDQMFFLVVFSLAALLLLVRVHADDERVSWLQRRIGNPSTVTSLYLRGGTAFVTIAVAGALFLTTTAASAPLSGAFSGLNDKLVDIGSQIQRFFPVGAGTRFSGVTFGPSASIQGRWETTLEPALTIQVPVGDPAPYYWKAVAYDTFVYPNTWTLSHQNVGLPMAAGAPILDTTGDQLESPDLRKELTFTVTKLNEFSGRTVFAPDAVASVDKATNLTVVGSADFFGELETRDSYKTYTATSLVPRVGNDGFTENKLRAASVDYPADISAMYLGVPDGTFGSFSAKLEADIKSVAFTACLGRSQKESDPAGFCAANAYDPYDLADAARSVLRSSQFQYKTDVTALKCSDLSTVECFAEFRQGYCQYYATTMAMILRDLGVPTRFVEGWLPATPDPQTGIETILLSNSHAWVEVYFPGYGWVTFDPTGNGQTQPQALIPGDPVASASPATKSPRPKSSLNALEPPDRTIRPGAGGIGSTTGGSSNGPFIIVALLLIFVIGLLAVVAYQRGPRGPTQPETAWSAMVRLAGRFGWAPRPTQTPYEYAGALGDILPIARSDLLVVAAAKVEVAYGRKTLDADRLSTLRVAQRKLRITLLRLLFRRPKRRTRIRRI